MPLNCRGWLSPRHCHEALDLSAVQSSQQFYYPWNVTEIYGAIASSKELAAALGEFAAVAAESHQGWAGLRLVHQRVV